MMNNSHSHIHMHNAHTLTLINNALGTVFVILLNDEYNIMIITFQERFLFGDAGAHATKSKPHRTHAYVVFNVIQWQSRAAATYTKQMFQSFSHGIAFILASLQYSLCYVLCCALCGCGIKYNLVVSILHVGKSPLPRSVYALR